jgi:release factor glutamine methyltransferase
MRLTLKRALSSFLVPLTRWYLRKERRHTFRGIAVDVFPGVFHPGLFSSTHFLIRHLEKYTLSGKHLLELGCGSGLISVWASTKGANVVASDLSRRAVANAVHNSSRQGTSIQVIQSDLFDNIPKQTFDWIVINPPYYARPVRTEEELAWHCGEDFEYFRKLFASLSAYIAANTEVVMILTTEGCDVATIFSLADNHGFYFELLKERHALLDGKDYLFRIRRSLNSGPAVQS